MKAAVKVRILEIGANEPSWMSVSVLTNRWITLSNLVLFKNLDFDISQLINSVALNINLDFVPINISDNYQEVFFSFSVEKGRFSVGNSDAHSANGAAAHLYE